MNRVKIRLVWIVIMVAIVCFPLIIFSLQDQFKLGKTIQFTDNSQEDEIIRNHPVITALYLKNHSFYSDNDIRPEYNITVGSYTPLEEDKIKRMQAAFEKEVNQLLSSQVFPYSLLELQANEIFIADFGYLRDFTKGMSGHYYLTQYYRLQTDNQLSATYDYSYYANKIINFHITNKAVTALSPQQLKEMSLNMITYLEMDDIDDWQYNQDGYYQSQKANIYVYSHVKNYPSFDSLEVTVGLLDNFTYTNPQLEIDTEAS